MPEFDPPGPCRAEFICLSPGASSVFLVGTFNDWDMRATPLTRGDDGEWRAVLELPPGHYEYKWVVLYHGQLDVRDDSPYGIMSHVAISLAAMDESYLGSAAPSPEGFRTEGAEHPLPRQKIRIR